MEVDTYSHLLANVPPRPKAGKRPPPPNLEGSAAIEKAVGALEKGMGGGFLQTSAAQVVKKLVTSREAVPTCFWRFEYDYILSRAHY